MLVSDFDYALRHELIAQRPLANRSDSRMLHLSRQDATWRDRKFIELADLLRPDDLLVLNDTRVIPARLFGRRWGKRAQPLSQRNPAAKEFLKGKVEVLLTKPLGDWEWEALVHPGRKLRIGERMFFSSSAGEPELQAEIIDSDDYGRRRIRFDPVPDFHGFLQKFGHVPLPPYIHRPDTMVDRERYQTVYSRQPGSVAAPTAGLHFTEEILERSRQRGIGIAYVTLHVGLGTFQPVRTRKVEEHRLHSETYSITPENAGQINQAHHAGRRIVAIGTTTTRTLEYAASRSTDFHVEPGSGEADIFIYPGYRFKVVGALLTNFHLPQSTLLMLVSAFAEREFILRAYAHAVAERYRFYSYGDCMFIE